MKSKLELSFKVKFKIKVMHKSDDVRLRCKHYNNSLNV